MRVVRMLGDTGEASHRAVLREAAELLRSGRLVAFPTETVYGLGAHALDERAVRRIYEAKGRPRLNPLIVHVPDTRHARELASEWTSIADALAEAFWPGPLTLVVRKRERVPDIVSAGRDTVGIRVPSHPVALALLEEAGIPIAAPSANLSTQLSPTTAQHVVRGLGDLVDLILDGGPTTVGIESTVVDATGPVPRILRPGMIAREAIARVAGAASIATPSSEGHDALPSSPGMLGRHYAPRARVLLFAADQREKTLDTARSALAQHQRVGAMVFASLNLDLIDERSMPRAPEEYGRILYATLHAFDEGARDLILIERPPHAPEWAAIRDRLERAAT